MAHGLSTTVARTPSIPSRFWWIAPACVLLTAQIINVAVLGTQGRGPLNNFFVDLGLNLIAVAVIWQASRRSRGLARYLWFTAIACFSFFCCSLLIGIFAEAVKAYPGLAELSDELSVFWLAPLSLTLFLDPDFESKKFDPIHILDFAQILLFWVAIYFFFHRMPAQVGQNSVIAHSWLQATWAGSLVYDLSMATLFLLRSLLTSSAATRKLFGRLSIYLAAVCLADFFYDYYKIEAGTWYQIIWTLLNIAPIVIAGTWVQTDERDLEVAPRTTGLIGDRLFPILSAFMVLMLCMVIVRERLSFAIAMVSISFLCSSLRVVIIQEREQRVARDLQAEVAERRRAEQQLLQNEEHLEEEVVNRTGELSAANAQLRNEINERQRLEEQLRQTQKMEAIGTLSGGIAHDFNNLLTVIRGYARMVLDKVEHDPAMRADVEQIDEAGARAAALTSQLLAFSRRQVLQPKIINLNVLVTNLDKMLQRLIGEDIELVTHTDRALGSVQADPGQIEQVIMNLVVNARDAMPRGGKLTLETANVSLDMSDAREHVEVVPGSYVMLAVSDNGIGMDAETKAHIFEPFFTTKDRSRGTGLGLSTVYGIVTQSGGTIWVYSEMGKGTTFKIFLPRVHEQAELFGSGQRPAATKGTETVLLVEDDLQVRKLARSILARSGYTVCEAENGAEALKVCEAEGTLHLLLTDVVMPGMSGRDLAAKVVEQRPEIKVLYMSGYTNDAIVHHGVLDTGISFLQKPFTPTALAAKVREVLDGVTVAES
jgi:signal transduction histidine kinase/ActR/RegA family two-component response regulator